MPPKGISTIEDVRALERVPLEERALPETVIEAIRLGATRCEGRDALVFIPDAHHPERVARWSFEALIDEVEAAARGFGALGVEPDGVVSLLLPNLPEAHFALWGAQTAAAVNPINPLLEVEHIAHILKACGAKVVVTIAALPGLDIFEKAVEAARRAGCVTSIVIINPARYAPGLKGLMGRALGKIKSRASGLQLLPFAQLRRLGAGRALPQKRGEDVGALFHTGGTTGAPKIAQLTHANQTFMCWAGAANRFMEEHKALFGGLPLFHVNGVLVSGLISWASGATVVLGPPQGYRSPGLMQNFWAIVEAHQIGGMSGVPTVYQVLLEQPIGDHDVSSLEFAICGAAPISKAVFERFEARTGVALMEGYGATEGTCVSTINPGYGERRVGSVGLRLPYQELGVFIPAEGGEGYAHAGVDAIGTVGIRGPNVFKGYLDPEDDAKAWLEVDGARWYDTGDMGRLDADGYLWLTGRKKELIIRGGHNIDPAMIEDAMALHPAVKLVAALGSPDPRVGELPVAYVTLEEGAEVDEAGLLEHAKAHIQERAAVPKAILIIDEVPLTAIGKIFKPALKMREVDRVARRVLDEALGADRVAVETRLDAQRGALTEIQPRERPLSAEERASLEEALHAYTIQWALMDP